MFTTDSQAGSVWCSQVRSLGLSHDLIDQWRSPVRTAPTARTRAALSLSRCSSVPARSSLRAVARRPTATGAAATTPPTDGGGADRHRAVATAGAALADFRACMTQHGVTLPAGGFGGGGGGGANGSIPRTPGTGPRGDRRGRRDHGTGTGPYGAGGGGGVPGPRHDRPGDPGRLHRRARTSCRPASGRVAAAVASGPRRCSPTSAACATTA